MFEQVSIDGNQMSLVREGRARGSSGLMLGVGGGGCTVRSNASRVMVTWGPPFEHRDTCEKIPVTSLAGDKNLCMSHGLLQPIQPRSLYLITEWPFSQAGLLDKNFKW